MALGQTGGRDGVVRLSGLALKFPAVTVAIWVARLNGLSRAQAATPYLSRRGHGPGPVMWTALQDRSARPRRKGSQICVPRSRDPGQSLPPEKPSPSHSGAHGRPSSRGPVGQQPQRSALPGHRGAQNDHERERHERRCPPAFTMPPSALPPPSWRESPPRPRSGPSGRQSRRDRESSVPSGLWANSSARAKASFEGPGARSLGRPDCRHVCAQCARHEIALHNVPYGFSELRVMSILIVGRHGR